VYPDPQQQANAQPSYSAPPVPPSAPPSAPPLGQELVPAGMIPPDPAAPVLVQIGDIRVTQSAVLTPAGWCPTRGANWNVVERVYPRSKIPTWAIVLAIVGFFCLTIFSLLFLLAKETVYEGFVEVWVQNGQFQYVTRVPVNGPAISPQIHGQVNYARNLSMM
jgi:hypothetical protein